VKLAYRSGYTVERGSIGSTLSGRILVTRSDARSADHEVGIRHEFAIEVDPAQIGYSVNGAEASATFTLNVIVEDDNGNERVGTYNLINHAYPRKLWDDGDIEPLTIRGTVEMPPGTYTMRAVFRNMDSGWIGELDRTVTVDVEPSR